MPRLFLGNFEFEHRLADASRQLPAKLQRINAELVTSWLAVAEDGDYLWTPQEIPKEFFEQAVRDGLPRVIPVTGWEAAPIGVTCVPWGWTDDIRRLCDQYGWNRNDPPADAVRAANSRRFSAALELEWQCGLDFAGAATSLAEIERLASFHGDSARWVIKAEFGMSGRERLIGAGAPTVTDRNWIERRLKSDGVVFYEPWIERVEEAGIQIHIPREGVPELIGVVPMFVNHQGQYAGSQFQAAESTASARWDTAVEFALRAAVRIQQLGYWGPLGIDAMRYQDGKAIRCRPLQDINARWTMGRLSLGFRRLLPTNICGYWLHGPVAADSESGTITLPLLREFLRERGLRLSPDREILARTILGSTMPFTPEALEAVLSKSLICSRSTIYRTLQYLLDAALITEVTDDTGDTSYSCGRSFQRRFASSAATIGGTPARHQSAVWGESSLS